jgi:hypothetical protein
VCLCENHVARQQAALLEQLLKHRCITVLQKLVHGTSNDTPHGTLQLKPPTCKQVPRVPGQQRRLVVVPSCACGAQRTCSQGPRPEALHVHVVLFQGCQRPRHADRDWRAALQAAGSCNMAPWGCDMAVTEGTCRYRVTQRGDLSATAV